MALPTNWNDIPAPAVDATIGDEWIGEARSLALIVPFTFRSQHLSETFCSIHDIRISRTS